VREPRPGRGRCLAIVVARDEQPRIRDVLARLPGEACGMDVDVLVVDDGSEDLTPEIARRAGAEVISHSYSLGLGAALRSGLDRAREDDYDAAVYIDGDGEYDSAELPAVLDPVARGRASYVVGSRFLARPDGRHERRGMTWHRTLANRTTTAALATLMDGAVLTDGQSGFRAFSREALARARIRHDFNYAQVLTLSLWGASIEPVEVPISYRRRNGGHSFVRYPEYLVRVAPALWRQWRDSKAARATNAPPTAPASAYGQTESPKNGKSPVSGPNGASGLGTTSPPSPTETSR
jgi:glycosyltransferase involved in cell wall biosynthesis